MLSHRRWPFQVNLVIVIVSTASTAVFIRRLYYSDAMSVDPAVDGLRFAIAAVVYILAFVLLIRQYVGLYPEYLVASGKGGFTLRKRLYQNIVRVEEARTSGHETEVLFYFQNRERLRLTLPDRGVPLVYELIEKNKPEL